MIYRNRLVKKYTIMVCNAFWYHMKVLQNRDVLSNIHKIACHLPIRLSILFLMSTGLTGNFSWLYSSDTRSECCIVLRAFIIRTTAASI